MNSLLLNPDMNSLLLNPDMNSLLLNPIPIGVFISNKDGGSFKLERKNHKEGGKHPLPLHGNRVNQLFLQIRKIIDISKEM